jgi:acetylornithine/N-succinyldiaminopimelate aminotransferase
MFITVLAIICLNVAVPGTWYGDQGGTFNGNAFVTAVGCAVLEEIAKPGFLAGVAEAGARLAKRLRSCRSNTSAAKCVAAACFWR